MDHFSRLSLDSMANIFRYLDWKDLQQVSLTNNHLRRSVMDDPFEQQILLPTHQYPLYEIQKSKVNSIKINQAIPDYEWFLSTVLRFKNINNLEIANDGLQKYILSWICHVVLTVNSIRTVTVHRSLSTAWNRVISAHRNFSSTVTTNVIEETTTAENNNVVVNPLLKGVNPSEIPVPDVPWLGQFPNIIENFNTFRNSSIHKLHIQPRLNTIEEALALNGIIHVSPGKHTQYMFNVNEWEEIYTLANSTYNPHQIQSNVSDEDFKTIYNITSAFQFHCKTQLSTIQQFTRELTTPYLTESYSLPTKNCCKMLLNYSEKLNYDYSTVTMSEDSFTINVFDPVYDAFFRGVRRVINHGADHYLTESKQRRRKIAAEFNEPLSAVVGRKPDRSLEWTSNQHQHHICLVEIKTEATSRSRPDLVKLGTMMKDCLDSMLNNGLKRQKCIIMGILQEGRRCTAYSLYSPSNYFYVMQELDTCFMPSSYRDLDGLFGVSVCMSRCRNLVDRMVEVLNEYDTADDEEDEGGVFAMQLTCASPKRHCQYYS